MGAAEVTQFLRSLAVHRNVAASTQNQALSALLFLYRNVLEQEPPWLDGIVRAKTSERLPIVLTRDEVDGAGLRLLECAHLRINDVDFATHQIVVRTGKGDRDRVTMRPDAVKPALARHLEFVKQQHEADLTHGAGWVELPWALGRKCIYFHRETGQRRSRHLHESVLQRPV